MRALAPTLVFLVAAFAAVAAPACDYPAGPPDSQEVTAEGDGVIWAYYSNATDVYRHGVLGDIIEARVLRAMTATTGPCETVEYLGDDSVFEDISPRIADVTGDGLNDVITVKTRFHKGSSLAIYGMDGRRFRRIAATPYINYPYRWLAPAGIADFDGDGVKDVAYVETPHIGGILKIWSFRDNQPRELAALAGFSNHRIGENFYTGGVRDCGRGPELVIPSDDWTRTLLARYRNGAIEVSVLAEEASPEIAARFMECP